MLWQFSENLNSRNFSVRRQGNLKSPVHHFPVCLIDLITMGWWRHTGAWVQSMWWRQIPDESLLLPLPSPSRIHQRPCRPKRNVGNLKGKSSDWIRNVNLVQQVIRPQRSKKKFQCCKGVFLNCSFENFYSLLKTCH